MRLCVRSFVLGTKKKYIYVRGDSLGLIPPGLSSETSFDPNCDKVVISIKDDLGKCMKDPSSSQHQKLLRLRMMVELKILNEP